jgi:hypothetical protein
VVNLASEIVGKTIDFTLERLTVRSLLIFISLVCLAAFAAARPSALLQDHTYSSPKVDYQVEFPSPMWKLVDEPDEVHQHAEFIYNDRNDGYLRIRKEALPDGQTVEEFARQDQEQKEHFRPGYVDGKGERFSGRMSGFTIAFEFTQAGKPMAGRTYYLQSGDQTVYALRFTGVRDKLARIRNQTDQIARTFKLKG